MGSGVAFGFAFLDRKTVPIGIEGRADRHTYLCSAFCLTCRVRLVSLDFDPKLVSRLVKETSSRQICRSCSTSTIVPIGT